MGVFGPKWHNSLLYLTQWSHIWLVYIGSFFNSLATGMSVGFIKLSAQVNMDSGNGLEPPMFMAAYPGPEVMLGTAIRKVVNLSELRYKTPGSMFHTSISLSWGVSSWVKLIEAEIRLLPFCRRHFKMHFFNENVCISFKISLKFPMVRINNIPALVQIMAWRRSGDKPLSELMMVR